MDVVSGCFSGSFRWNEVRNGLDGIFFHVSQLFSLLESASEGFQEKKVRIELVFWSRRWEACVEYVNVELP
jgi:hypothetical protein